MSTGPVINRRAVRAVMLTADRRVLLMQVREPTSGRTFWITPGGGIEDGENAEVCLQREIREETGITECLIGPHIWTRRHRFGWKGRTIDQREAYYLVRVDEFLPIMTDAEELMIHRGFRWWGIEEIQASSELFAPRKLGLWLAQLVLRGVPAKPIDVGV